MSGDATAAPEAAPTNGAAEPAPAAEGPSELEVMTGKTVPADLRTDLSTGADELALVRSGLDDTMRLAYREVRAVFQEDGVEDLRTAAFVVALRKIAHSYMELGV